MTRKMCNIFPAAQLHTIVFLISFMFLYIHECIITNSTVLRIYTITNGELQQNSPKKKKKKNLNLNFQHLRNLSIIYTYTFTHCLYIFCLYRCIHCREAIFTYVVYIFSLELLVFLQYQLYIVYCI